MSDLTLTAAQAAMMPVGEQVLILSPAAQMPVIGAATYADGRLSVVWSARVKEDMEALVARGDVELFDGSVPHGEGRRIVELHVGIARCTEARAW